MTGPRLQQCHAGVPAHCHPLRHRDLPTHPALSVVRRRWVQATVVLRMVPRCFPVTSVLVAALVAARILDLSAPDLAHRWQWASSTTLVQLSHNPLGVLLSSIPWVSAGPVAPWLALVGLAVGTLESTVGSPAAFLVLFGGHTGATLLSQGILGVRVATGELPATALHVLDVGPSYVVAAALAAVVGLPGRHRPRIAAGATLVGIAPAMIYRLPAADLDSIGHLAAFALGGLTAALPTLRRRATRRTRPPIPDAAQAVTVPASAAQVDPEDRLGTRGRTALRRGALSP